MRLSYKRLAWLCDDDVYFAKGSEHPASLHKFKMARRGCSSFSLSSFAERKDEFENDSLEEDRQNWPSGGRYADVTS
jgi:hypothetical protein